MRHFDIFVAGGRGGGDKSHGMWESSKRGSCAGECKCFGGAAWVLSKLSLVREEVFCATKLI